MELVTTNFSKKHGEISQAFVERVTELLSAKRLNVSKYAIDTKSWGGEAETIEIQCGDNVTLQVNLTTRKN